MRIGSRDVGPGHPTFVIAEAGSNHGGSLEAALALVDAAADAGADAVKFQLWDADRMYPRETPEWQDARKWQMPVDWLVDLSERAAARSIEFLCSAFDLGSLELVDRFVPAHKVASLEAAWLPYVVAVVAKKKPVLLSTGAMTGPEVVQVLAAIAPADIVLLHATVSYPTPLVDADLRALRTLATARDRPVIRTTSRRLDEDALRRLKDSWSAAMQDPRALIVLDRDLELTSVGATYSVGYSDHTTEPRTAPCAAVALGACVIEKHLRLNVGDHDRLVGEYVEPPDLGHSLAAEDFREMVAAIRLTEMALGSSEKRVRDVERPYLRYRRGPLGLRGA